MPNSPIHEKRNDSDASIGGMKNQPPKCLGIPMREPTKIQLQSPPAHQWELRLPGLPFEVHVCDSGRWVITSGRDSVAYGCEGTRDRAAEVAGNVLLGWANGIRALVLSEAKPEPAKPFEHPMAATKEDPPPVIREPMSSMSNRTETKGKP